MLKRTLFAAMIFLAPMGAFAQGACYPAGIVLLDTGRPANGASVRVCTAGSTGTPCTPGASLFTDPTLGTPLGGSPVATTDAHGNFGFCAAAGANYDLQISGTGITTLNIKNLPLPPTTPIAAASLTSSSANPATVGLIKLASGDCLDWRNNANSGNIQLCKTGAAAGGVPADTFDMTAGGGVEGVAFIGATANPAQSGLVRAANNVVAVAARNAANSGDLALLQADASNNAQITPALRQVEQSAPSGIASSDLLWADSTDHRWKMANNNGTATDVAGLSDNLGSFASTTSAQLAGVLSDETGSGGGFVRATSPTITTPTFSTGITGSGTGFKHTRVGTGSISAGTRASVTVTWPGTAFADLNYTEICSVEDGTTGATAAGLVLERVNAKAVGSIAVTINNPSGGAVTGTVNCSAAHD